MNKTIASRRRLLGAGSLLLLISFFFAYWEVELKSLGNPRGAQLAARVGHVDGWPDRLTAAAGTGPDRLGTSSAVAAAVALVFLAAAAAGARSRWSVLLWLPAIAYPAVVLQDAAAFFAENSCALAGGDGGCRAAHLPLSGSIEHHGVLFVTHLGAGTFFALAATLVLIAGAILHELRQGK